jgi:hypothetical protein
MSVASIAALSLPMLGAGVAAGQQIMSDPTPSTAEPAALRSSTAKVAAAAQQSIDTAQTEVVALVAETTTTVDQPDTDASDATVDADTDASASAETEVAEATTTTVVATAETTAPSETTTVPAPAQESAETGSEEAGSEKVGAEPSGGIDPLRGWSEDDLDAYAAYWEGGYNYRQLLVLADEWNLSEFEAKARAGNAILTGDTSSFDALVADIKPAEQVAYDGPDAAFWDAGYTYDDAVALAEEWNIDTYEAKVRVSEMLASGTVAVVADILIG